MGRETEIGRRREDRSVEQDGKKRQLAQLLLGSASTQKLTRYWWKDLPTAVTTKLSGPLEVVTSGT